MSLYDEFMEAYLQESTIRALTELKREVMHNRCYQTLEAIRTVLDDECLDDAACFDKIESIVRIYETMGGKTTRHDFG